jgi:predicted Zn-dependent protease
MKALGLILALAASSPVKNDATVKRAMEDEMARATVDLHTGAEPPPYWVGFTVTDVDRQSVSASLGKLVESRVVNPRVARVDLRVGRPEEDNTNFVAPLSVDSLFLFVPPATSRDDDYLGLRRALWQATDSQYKLAVEALAAKKASKSTQSIDSGDRTPDFAPAPPVTSNVARPSALGTATLTTLEVTAVRLSRVLAEFPALTVGRVDGTVEHERRRLLTSEKTWTDSTWDRARLDITAETIAVDGQRLSATTSFTADGVGGLYAHPRIDELEAEVRALAKNLAEQRAAPLAEPGSGSVVFEGRAASQLARLLFTASLSGQPIPRTGREPVVHDGSASFADKLGQSVAPKWLTVEDDPSARAPSGRPLFGTYVTDDEGVLGQRVTLIDRGTVKTLLMSRAPRKQVPLSNGHGRGRSHASASNVIVSAEKGNALSRGALLAVASRAAGPKGTVYVVRELDRGSGLGRGQTLRATVAFRVNAKDGREEPVRGVSLEGFTLQKLKKDLVAAGTERALLEESNGVPVSVSAPALAFQDVDVGKPSDTKKQPPLYPAPLPPK